MTNDGAGARPSLAGGAPSALDTAGPVPVAAARASAAVPTASVVPGTLAASPAAMRPGERSRAADAALLTAAAGWLAVLSLILAHRDFITHDSLISYAHAWWVEHHLWHGHGVPWRMPVLGHGRALTFPYGVLPWTVAALLWPLAGDRAVTAVLVGGAVGLIAGTRWAFPECRRGWWAVAVLVNPMLVAAPLSGQIPFMWGAALLMAGIGSWRRGMRRRAVLLAGLGQLCHPAVVLPVAGLLVLLRLRSEPDRGALLRCYAWSLLIAAPAVWPVLTSPVFQDSSLATKLTEFAGTVGLRAVVFAVPLLAACAHRGWPRWVPPVAAAGALALNVALVAPLGMRFSWQALARSPDRTLLAFVHTTQFRPGATYRLLRTSDGKVGMYQLIRHGARLDSEFFPESIGTAEFPDERSYSAFLVSRRVDHVLIFDSYARRNRDNERELLGRMARAARRCVAAGNGTAVVGVTLVRHDRDWDDYRIDRGCATAAAVALPSGAAR
jgi:hypothetical protein